MKLVMCSGGLDSAYMLMETLLSGANVHAHHVILKTKQERWKQEYEAFKTQIRIVRGLGFEPEVSVSEVDVRDLPHNMDAYHYLHIAAAIASRRKDITTVQVGFLKDEMRNEDLYLIKWDAMLLTTYGFKSTAVLTFPLNGTDKCKIVKMVHKDLLNSSWSCRTPLAGKRCGSCRTCMAIEDCKDV